ncbi:MAG: DUF3047 domain-containing protein [Beijerinckiaceae bacterium]|nr:DUF3047 domain-containing protein [Beijerinckiaceae bacterium]
MRHLFPIRMLTAALFALAGAHGAIAQQAPNIPVGRFSAGDLQGWESRAFKGATEYRIVSDGATRVLAARANGGASGRFRKIKIDLTRTPFINFSWKVSGVYKGINEAAKSGDDFPARVYVVRERGLMGMNSAALNYVWSSARPVGSLWPSPYTAQVKLIALDSGPEKAGVWTRHKRNVREDLRRAFGEDITEIDAVALMSDADNFGGSVEAAYGDIWFSAR